MTFIKEKYSRDKFEDSFKELWNAMWGPEQLDLSKPDLMAQVLSRHFPEDDVRKILQAANSKEYKQKLQEVTQQVVESGAFGCPWFQVTNAKGVQEPFFGSDR
jgi:glutathione S-transferase kappa 1